MEHETEHPINQTIKEDFAGDVTMRALNSTQQLDIALKPEVRKDMYKQEQAVENLAQNQSQGYAPTDQYEISEEQQAYMDMMHEGHKDFGAVINGRDLYALEENKGWFREGKHGREVSVESISVQPSREFEGKYTMTAVINGEAITHEISSKEYNKFLAVNDLQRMKMFSKIFNEVDMKDIQSTDVGAKIGAGVLAALTVGAAVVGVGMASRPRPEFYGSGHGHGNMPRPYFKPGVDSPEDVAARNYDAMINNPNNNPHRGHSF